MDINLELGIVTKVDAINSVLASIGSIGINSDEEIDWNVDAADASRMIDNISQQVQTNDGKGFWFNRETFHKFKPNYVNGFVSVPSNTLSCLVNRDRNGKPLPITLRGKRMFDAQNFGYDMRELASSDGFVYCTLVVALPFEDLPATAKHYITVMSRFWTVSDKEGDQIKLNQLGQAASIAENSLKREDGRQRRHNMFDNPTIKSTVAKVGGWINN